MVSDTAKVTMIRKRKRGKKGKSRKREIRKHGTTPAFPINPAGK